jgi:CRISPR system Cascade subunit CasB
MTTATTDPPRKAPGRRRHELGDHVAGIVRALQEQVLRDPPRPEAVGALARLRRGIGRVPGFDYTLEDYLWVPDGLLNRRPGGEADDAEYAAHDSITLYALHQQSRRERMHADGSGLGAAMARLVRAVDGPDGVRRRFAALGTASSYPETVYHLRSLVTMLREHQIPLDYGLLADDLRRLRRPANRARVQAAWGREFFRHRTDESTPEAPKESAE